MTCCTLSLSSCWLSDSVTGTRLLLACNRCTTAPDRQLLGGGLADRSCVFVRKQVLSAR
jgi:hypothetical protein